MRIPNCQEGVESFRFADLPERLDTECGHAGLGALEPINDLGQGGRGTGAAEAVDCAEAHGQGFVGIEEDLAEFVDDRARRADEEEAEGAFAVKGETGGIGEDRL